MDAFWYKTEIKIIYFVQLCLIALIVCDCMVYPDPNFLIFQTKNGLICFSEDEDWFFLILCYVSHNTLSETQFDEPVALFFLQSYNILRFGHCSEAFTTNSLNQMLVWGLWFNGQIVWSKIEHLSNIYEKIWANYSAVKYLDLFKMVVGLFAAKYTQFVYIFDKYFVIFTTIGYLSINIKDAPW